jgi:hypothetical protein
MSAKWSLSFGFPTRKTCIHFSPYVLYSHFILFLFDYPINNWARVQTMKLLIIPSSPFACYFPRLRPKYLPQHPIVKNPQPVFFAQCEGPSLIIV